MIGKSIPPILSENLSNFTRKPIELLGNNVGDYCVVGLYHSPWKRANVFWGMSSVSQSAKISLSKQIKRVLMPQNKKAGDAQFAHPRLFWLNQEKLACLLQQLSFNRHGQLDRNWCLFGDNKVEFVLPFGIRVVIDHHVVAGFVFTLEQPFAQLILDPAL